MKYQKYLGQEYGSWRVKEIMESEMQSRPYVLATCRLCNRDWTVRLDHILSGGSTRCRSCSSKSRKPRLTHGDTGTRLHRVWLGMKSRCYVKTSGSYKWYGKRGICICDAWHDYTIFKAWALTNGYKEGLSIDRLNPEEGYSPANCRWIPNNQNIPTYVWILGSDNTITRGFDALAEYLQVSKSLLQHRFYRKQPIKGIYYTFCNPTEYI